MDADDSELTGSTLDESTATISSIVTNDITTQPTPSILEESQILVEQGDRDWVVN